MKTLLLLTSMLSACTSTLPDLKYPDGHTRIPVNLKRSVVAATAAEPAQDPCLQPAAPASRPGPVR
ncbi:hypothetical protein HSX11_09325 [Oxalobacteraceae bacterium]|nr:hypothetical protein [Oxalobacteraceae bacterium]